MSAEQDEAEVDYTATLEHYARVEWVVFGKWDRLHKPETFAVDQRGWCFRDVTTACGLRRDEAFIPGIFTRMGAERCGNCCDRSGFPRGIGSPKNDDECRALVGLPTKAESRAALTTTPTPAAEVGRREESGR